MTYSIKIEKFEGPLDLLLQLIESDKLEITEVSLLQVTEPFVKLVRESKNKIPPEELADFLVIAAKLVYLKSRALLPMLTDAELEEGPDLATQLRMYKAFVEAANRLGEMAKANRCSYSRVRRPRQNMEAGFIAPKGVTAAVLQGLYVLIIRRLEPVLALPQAAIARAITIEDKIAQLFGRVRQFLKTSFHKFLAESHDRSEMVVSFLALLELVKQRQVKVEQKDLFQEIQLSYEA